LISRTSINWGAKSESQSRRLGGVKSVWPDPFALPRDSLMQRVNLLILVCLIFPFWVFCRGGFRICINSGSYVDLKAELYGYNFQHQKLSAFALYKIKFLASVKYKTHLILPV